jgi:hypothetical protein
VKGTSTLCPLRSAARSLAVMFGTALRKLGSGTTLFAGAVSQKTPVTVKAPDASATAWKVTAWTEVAMGARSNRDRDGVLDRVAADQRRG